MASTSKMKDLETSITRLLMIVRIKKQSGSQVYSFLAWFIMNTGIGQDFFFLQKILQNQGLPTVSGEA